MWEGTAVSRIVGDVVYVNRYGLPTFSEKVLTWDVVNELDVVTCSFAEMLIRVTKLVDAALSSQNTGNNRSNTPVKQSIFACINFGDIAPSAVSPCARDQKVFSNDEIALFVADAHPCRNSYPRANSVAHLVVYF